MVDLALLSMALLLRVAQERIAQVGIPALDERNIDACLIAVFLMGRYEGATYRPGNLNSKKSITSLQSWSRHDGAMAILKVWNDKLSYNPATFIIKQTRRGLIKSCLLRNLPLPDWLLNCNRFGEHDVKLDYDCIAIRIVNLHCASASAVEEWSTDCKSPEAK